MRRSGQTSHHFATIGSNTSLWRSHNITPTKSAYPPLDIPPILCYTKTNNTKGGDDVKKIFISLLLLISTLMLSSCQVNWFGSHFDVPWYFIAVPVFVLFIVLYVIIVSKTYVCPKCKTEFKPKWYQIYITIHFNNSRIAKCPNCGRKGFCKRKD